MFPDFVKVKNIISERFTRYLQEAQMESGLLKGIKKEKYFEGNKHDFADIDEQPGENATEFNRLSAAFEVHEDDIIENGIDAYLKHFKALAEDLSGQMEASLLAAVSKATDKTGNIIDGKGKELSPEVLLDALEKIALPFNKDGSYEPMTIVLHPEAYEKLLAKMDEYDKDPAFKKRYDEIIQKKRAEWDARESNRKLVD
jgi:hypothetical protein